VTQLGRGYVQADGHRDADPARRREHHPGGHRRRRPEGYVRHHLSDDVDPNELALYFLPEDRLDNDPIGDRWRVQPLRIVQDGDVIHLRGKAWQLVKPYLLERIGDATIDAANDDNFVAGLDIYRRTTAARRQR
jgi:hypothetical protein